MHSDQRNLNDGEGGPRKNKRLKRTEIGVPRGMGYESSCFLLVNIVTLVASMCPGNVLPWSNNAPRTSHLYRSGICHVPSNVGMEFLRSDRFGYSSLHMKAWMYLQTPGAYGLGTKLTESPIQTCVKAQITVGVSDWGSVKIVSKLSVHLSHTAIPVLVTWSYATWQKWSGKDGARVA